MAEYPIGPKHNVFKKYRTVNYINSYVFAPPADLTTNTEIGGVASTISTPALLASKLAIDVSRITNFTIVGSDIKFKITGSYTIPFQCFKAMPIANYLDLDNLVTDVAQEAFASILNPCLLSFKGIINLTGIYITSLSQNMTIVLDNCISISNSGFADLVNSTLYIPRCVNLGTNQLDNSVFVNSSNNKIYCHPSLSTSNAGGVEGDIAYAISRGCLVSYVTNFTSPISVSTLAIGAIYNTAVQLNFTPPTGSVNAIEHYECYANGVFKNIITASGEFITGLTTGTSNAIAIVAVDIFYNKSVVSNSVNAMTTIYSTPVSYTDTDANSYISVTGITGVSKESAYQLIVDLKTVGLYSKIQALYLFKGTTASQHKFNAKNPVDTDAGFRLVFTGSATFSELGYQLNGGSYANTKLIPSVSQSLNNNGMTVVCGTNVSNSGDNWAIAAYNSGTQNSIMSLIGNGALNLNGVRVTGVRNLGQKGIHTAVKKSSALSKTFKNGVLNLIGKGGGSLPTNPFTIGAIGTINYGYISERIQIAIIHEGLSDSEVALMHSIIDLSESIAGRKTW